MLASYNRFINDERNFTACLICPNSSSNIFDFRINLNENACFKDYMVGLIDYAIPRIIVQGDEFKIEFTNSPLENPHESDWLKISAPFDEHISRKSDVMDKLRLAAKEVTMDPGYFYIDQSRKNQRWYMVSKFDLHIRMNNNMKAMIRGTTNHYKLKKSKKTYFNFDSTQIIDKAPPIGFLFCSLIYNMREISQYEKLLCKIPMEEFYKNNDYAVRCYEQRNIAYKNAVECDIDHINFALEFPNCQKVYAMHHLDSNPCIVQLSFIHKKNFNPPQSKNLGPLKWESEEELEEPLSRPERKRTLSEPTLSARPKVDSNRRRAVSEPAQGTLSAARTSNSETAARSPSPSSARPAFAPVGGSEREINVYQRIGLYVGIPNSQIIDGERNNELLYDGLFYE